MAHLPPGAGGLVGGWTAWSAPRVPGLDRRDLDRHASGQPLEIVSALVRPSPLAPRSAPKPILAGVATPEFGQGVAHRAEPCTPSELYRALAEADDHVHFFEPAFLFIGAALASIEPPVAASAAGDARAFAQ